MALDTISKRQDFVAIASNGLKSAKPAMVLQALKRTEHSGVRVGFTVTKKVGNAVIRNRVKRRLRAAAREVLKQHAQDGMDYVLIGRKLCVHYPYNALCKDLENAVNEIHERYYL